MGQDQHLKGTASPASPESLRLFRAKRQNILDEAATRSMGFRDEIEQHGSQAEVLIRAGLEFTLRAIESAMHVGNMDILDFQIPWGMDRLQHDGVQPGHVLHRFQILKDVVDDLLPEENAREINQFIGQLVAKQKEGMRNE